MDFHFLTDFRFSLESGHRLDTFSMYNVRQIVDEITISPLIRKVKKSRYEPGLFYIAQPGKSLDPVPHQGK